MPALAISSPLPQFFDLDGTPLSGGKLYFGAVGDNPETAPVTVYWDAAATQPASQPIRTLNGYAARAGSPAVVYVVGNYSLTVRDRRGRLVLYESDSSSFDNSQILQAQIDAIHGPGGAALVGVQDAAGNYDGTNVEAVLAEVATMFYGTRYSVEDAKFGASSTKSAAQNTAAIQACIDAAPEGAVVYLPRLYSINDELTISKRITVMGPYSGPLYLSAAFAGLRQVTPGKSCFKLVATLGMYAFGQYGIIGLRFIGFSMEGPSNASKAVAAIRCDTSVNGGDFHVRECLFYALSVRWMTTGIDLTGIAYLNNFYSNSITYCDTPVRIARGVASDNGGQTRFYGGFYGLSRVGISLNEDGSGGSFGFHGVSVGENSEYGIRCHEEALLYTSPDCEFESNVIAGIYVEIKEANPNTTGPKTIGGKFLTNGADVYINKTSTAFAGGGFHFPLKIDDAYLGSAVGLKVDVPAGHAPIDSPAFILGRNITGPTGPVTASQISANFAGTDERKGFYVKRVVLPAGYVSGTVIGYLPPGLIVTSARMYFTANATGSTGIQLGDQTNASRYLSGINAQSVALNTWQNGTLALPQDIIGSTNNLLRVTATGGWLSAQAVVEIQGYIS